MSSQIQVISSSVIANKKQYMESLRYDELKDMASGSKIKGRSKMNKAQLVDALLKQWIKDQDQSLVMPSLVMPSLTRTVTLKICRGLNIEVDGLVRCPNTSNGEYCNEHSHRYRLDKPDDCPVCMDTISSRTETPLSCGHWVHKHCLVPTNLHMCPVCRQSMQPNEVRYVFGANHQQHNSYAHNYYMPFNINEPEHFQVIQGAAGAPISSFQYLFGEDDNNGLQYHSDYEDDDYMGNFDGVSDNVDNFYRDEHVSQPNPFDALDANVIDIIIREIEMRPNNNPYTNVPNDLTDIPNHRIADFHNYVFHLIEVCSNMNNWNLDDTDIMMIRNRMLFNMDANMDSDDDAYPQDRNLLAINYNLFTVVNLDNNFLQRVDELVRERIRAVYASEIPPLVLA